MMVVRKEDQKKLVYLVVAIVAVIGFIGFQYVQGTAPTAAAPSPVKGVAEQVGQASAANAARDVAAKVNDKNAQVATAAGTTGGSTPVSAPLNPSGDIELPTMYVANAGNPFRSVIPEVKPNLAPPPRQSTRTMDTRPPGPTGPLVPPIEMIMPDIKVMGIVTGENEVAVVEIAGKPVVVHRGDLIAPMTTVQEIERYGIVVRFDKRLIKIPIL